MPFVICDACKATGTLTRRLFGFRWCGAAECHDEIVAWASEDYDADELGVDPEEEFDA